MGADVPNDAGFRPHNLAPELDELDKEGQKTGSDHASTKDFDPAAPIDPEIEATKEKESAETPNLFNRGKDENEQSSGMWEF